MSNPTSACHTWKNNEDGKDFLALYDKQTGFVGGIDNTGTGWGSLATALSGQIQTTVTSAQLLSLHTTPIVLVPAQGAGTVVLPTVASMIYFAGTTPYTITGSDGILYVNWNANNLYESCTGLEDAGFLDQTTSQFQSVSAYTYTVSTETTPIPLSVVENQPLTLSIADTLTLGNGTVQVNILYKVFTIS